MWWSRPKVSDRLQSVRSIDEDIVGDVVIAIGWVVACQSLWSFLRNESVVDEVGPRACTSATHSSLRKREILMLLFSF